MAAGVSDFESALAKHRNRNPRRPRNTARRKIYLASKNADLDRSRFILTDSGMEPSKIEPNWNGNLFRTNLIGSDREILLQDQSGSPLAVSGKCLNEDSQHKVEQVLNQLMVNKRLRAGRKEKKARGSRQSGFNTAAVWYRNYCSQHAIAGIPVESSDYQIHAMRQACQQIDRLTSCQILNFLRHRVPHALNFFINIEVPIGTTKPTLFSPGLLFNEECCTAWHKDRDPSEGFCIIIAFGNHRGGGLKIRRNITYHGNAYDGLVFPSGEGRITVMRSSLLEHSNELYEGTRHSLVWFVDNGLFQWNLRQRQLQHKAPTVLKTRSDPVSLH